MTGAAVVGYVSEAALAAAVDDAGGVVTRRIAALRVAEIRDADLVTLAGHPGITYLEGALQRAPAAEPGLLFANHGVAPEWQYAATRADAVPDSVLRAAGSMRIAVLDTGADLTAPDLASKSPARFNVRTGTEEVPDTNGHGPSWPRSRRAQ
jgi:hypothetical protein